MIQLRDEKEGGLEGQRVGNKKEIVEGSCCVNVDDESVMDDGAACRHSHRLASYYGKT